MSKIELINASCADLEVDVVVNAANDGLWEGSGICGVIFKKAGRTELANACREYKTPLNDGDAVITPAFNMKNAKAIIHAVGPNFARNHNAFRELFYAYYNSLKVLMENGYHSISFPLISSGIFGQSLDNPVAESTKQCLRAYKKFTEDYPEYDVDVATTGAEGMEKVEGKVYDLILLDVMLPGMSGFDLMVRIRRTMDVPVIFMTARTGEEDRLYGYELGCDDYVCKPFSLAELLAKVNALIRRSKGAVLDDVMRCGNIEIHKRALTVRVFGETVDLPPKELAILMILMERPGWTFSRDNLLDRAWGTDYFGNDRVVDNHVKKLRKSLGDAGRQIKTVFTKGYKIVE